MARGRSLRFAVWLLGPAATVTGCCAAPEPAPGPPRAAARPTRPAPVASAAIGGAGAAQVAVGPAQVAGPAQAETGARSWPEAVAWPASDPVVLRGRGPGRALGGSAVSFEPGPLGEVLATISRQADVNLVPEPGIDLEVEVEWGLREVAWRDALLLLCERYQLEDRRIGERTLYVTRPPRVTIQ